jgi:AraC-like DNA-binding protein
MNADLLFESPVVSIRKVECNAARGGAASAEWNELPSLAIPLRGCYAIERNRHIVVADPNTAIFFGTDCSQRVSHPMEGGDVTLTITASPDAGMDVARGTFAPLNSMLFFRTRLLMRGLGRGESPIHVEEQALAIVAGCSGASLPELTHRRALAVERAKVFLNQSFSDRVLLSDVARAGGMSPFGLARAFPIATGMTIHQYLVALRYAAVFDAITQGADDISRVAVDAGFAHHSHLTKSFARTFGSTPSRVRAMFANAGPVEDGINESSGGWSSRFAQRL